MNEDSSNDQECVKIHFENFDLAGNYNLRFIILMVVPLVDTHCACIIEWATAVFALFDQTLEAVALDFVCFINTCSANLML